MDEAPLRAGVVGVGHVGRHHARILAELPGVELVAVADTDAGRAGAVAERVAGAEPRAGLPRCWRMSTP